MHNNRLCPSEIILSEYLHGMLPAEEKTRIEKHLAGCTPCRESLVETYEILSKPDLLKIIPAMFRWTKKNRWFLGAFISLVFSFFLRQYFLQFLTVCFLMGGKWIIDSRTTRTLITIHEAWKNKDKEKTEKLFTQYDSKNK